jgi:chromosome segregation ATPase
MYKFKDKSPLNNAGQQIMTSVPRENTSEGKKGNYIELQQRIEDLTNEIQQKDITISALQRNCEGISLIYKEEKKKSLEWSEKIAAIDRENGTLRVRIQVLEKEKQRGIKDMEKVQEESKKLTTNLEDYRSCRLENQSIKASLEK